VTGVRAALAVVHVGTAAAWLGSMLYSLFVVRPRTKAFFSEDENREDFAIVLASGARWKVLALVTVLALSGVGLTVLEITAEDGPEATWAALVAAKGAALVVALGLFVYVSWRLWPARAKAHALGTPDLPRHQRRFALVAVALTLAVAAGLALGSVADALAG
jgi:putative copper export protein